MHLEGWLIHQSECYGQATSELPTQGAVRRLRMRNRASLHLQDQGVRLFLCLPANQCLYFNKRLVKDTLSLKHTTLLGEVGEEGIDDFYPPQWPEAANSYQKNRDCWMTKLVEKPTPNIEIDILCKEPSMYLILSLFSFPETCHSYLSARR